MERRCKPQVFFLRLGFEVVGALSRGCSAVTAKSTHTIYLPNENHKSKADLG